MARGHGCSDCGKKVPRWEAVSYGGPEGSRRLCLRCYNQEASAHMGVDVELIELEPFIAEGPRGQQRTFQFLQRVHATGVSIEAFEVQGGERQGYEFQVMGAHTDSPYLLLATLRRRIRAALAYRNLDYSEGRIALPISRPVHGRIDVDLETGEPVLWVDGQSLAWDQVARMLLSTEGWQLRLEVREPSDEW